ncbi:MAG: flagellar hook-basal body complex protein [Rhodospirillales bacterium]|nr:flagellar hook-basal body complex protein [Rhodospirillales bacterium]MBN8897633.1 flagellar hook-basal body complex protein [Rhodospirillales bacterium]
MTLSTNIAMSRLVAQQRALEVAANNMANANTPGYKVERVLFSDWLSRQRNVDPPAGGRVVAYTQDRATWREDQAGTVTHTANPFDLALTGDGFFTVQTPQGPRLTRDGRFGPRPDGTLADGAGAAVLDANGRPIQLSPADTRITIAGDGTISSENGELGRIGVVRVTDRMRMTAEGNTNFRADAPTAPLPSPGIVQGAMEDSNVKPVVEMTRMMSELREFQLVTQFVQAEFDRQKDAIDKILSPRL